MLAQQNTDCNDFLIEAGEGRAAANLHLKNKYIFADFLWDVQNF